MAGSSDFSRTWRQYLVTIVAAGTTFPGGMSLAWTSPVESQLVVEEGEKCPREFCVSKQQFSWIGAGVAMGALVFGLLAGSLMSRVGRKPALLIFALGMFAGWLMVAFAQASWMFFGGRFLLGSGFGGACVVVPVYVGEIAETPIRGRLLAFFESNIEFGIMATYILGFFFSMFTQSTISAAVMGLFAAAIFLIPESPRYLVSKNQMSEAKKALSKLRETNRDLEPEMKEMVEFQEAQKTQGVRVLFTDRTNRRALGLTLGLIAGFELSGVNGVLLYTEKIFEEAETNIRPDLAAVFVGVVSTAGCLCSIVFVDKVGRRFLLLVSYLLMFVCFLVMGAYFLLQTHCPELIKELGLVPVVTLCLYCFLNAVEAPVTFVIMGEIFAQNVKDTAASLSMTCNHVFQIAVSLLFPYLSITIGFGTAFLIFAAFNAGVFVFVFVAVPETKGKSFEEIQIMIGGTKQLSHKNTTG